MRLSLVIMTRSGTDDRDIVIVNSGGPGGVRSFWQVLFVFVIDDNDIDIVREGTGFSPLLGVVKVVEFNSSKYDVVSLKVPLWTGSIFVCRMHSSEAMTSLLVVGGFERGRCFGSFDENGSVFRHRSRQTWKCWRVGD